VATLPVTHHEILGEKKNSGYLYFDLVVCLAVIDADDAANHFRYNDHVAQVSLDTLQHSDICWLGVTKSIRTIKNIESCSGYLSGAR